MAFPEAINLPFNGEIIRSRFTRESLGSFRDDAGTGFSCRGTLCCLRGGLYRGLSPTPWLPRRSMLFGSGTASRSVPLRPREQPLPETLRAVSSGELPDDLHPFRSCRQILHWELDEQTLLPLRQLHGADPPTWASAARLRPRAFPISTRASSC